MIHAVKQAVKYLFEIEDKSDYSIEKKAVFIILFKMSSLIYKKFK